MTQPFLPCSPHVAAATTAAIAVLGAAVLAFVPATAAPDAALAGLTLVPSCPGSATAGHESAGPRAGSHARTVSTDVAATRQAPRT